ncbi:uncharacterized protein BCR38DRAFT_90742 [Pseudomassariella vexata]|uniref:FYVE-type domain-containing protein n=1 Tax=Pseudomassariella vexata TaxID=1141098 RepID=A0A1Y2EDS3_9PEZI|nr:uncharacterized protein BCR38DRAFT_90742 [Pseudomassariella vexata]ORY69710.1 hypothetical protein BCR38DRAFT_90742 [Pseudomassariella vexata]
MATDFIMPRLPESQQPHAFYFNKSQLPGFQSQSQSQLSMHNYQHDPPHSSSGSGGSGSRQISPLSTSHSNNASPTSPKSYHGRQLRPLYMPAVLRPTEHSSKKNPRKKAEGQYDDEHMRSNGSFISISGLGALGRLSRRSTGDSGKCMDSEWNLDLFPKPTAQPTRVHWKPDNESTICDEPSCMRSFSYWNRRHHCRKCGNIFCDAHSSFDIPLDQDAQYNPKGAISRACGHCHSEFRVWRSRTNSQASSDGSSVIRDLQSMPSTPIASTPGKIQPHPAEIAASVPRDWNWSTF